MKKKHIFALILLIISLLFITLLSPLIPITNNLFKQINKQSMTSQKNVPDFNNKIDSHADNILPPLNMPDTDKDEKKPRRKNEEVNRKSRRIRTRNHLVPINSIFRAFKDPPKNEETNPKKKDSNIKPSSIQKTQESLGKKGEKKQETAKKLENPTKLPKKDVLLTATEKSLHNQEKVTNQNTKSASELKPDDTSKIAVSKNDPRKDPTAFEKPVLQNKQADKKDLLGSVERKPSLIQRMMQKREHIPKKIPKKGDWGNLLWDVIFFTLSALRINGYNV